MNLPEWESDSKEEQRRLLEFIISALDSEDQESVREAGANIENVKFVRQLRQLHVDAKKLGRKVSKPGRRGRPIRGDDPVARAKADIKRIREQFRKHYGKVKRNRPPMAEDIAAERWGLTEKKLNEWKAKLSAPS